MGRSRSAVFWAVGSGVVWEFGGQSIEGVIRSPKQRNHRRPCSPNCRRPRYTRCQPVCNSGAIARRPNQDLFRRVTGPGMTSTQIPLVQITSTDRKSVV